MLQIAQFTNTIIFLLISAMHFYWAIGSFFGKNSKSGSAVIPEVNGKPLFVPSIFATFVVAIGLFLFAKISSIGLLNFWGLENSGPIKHYGNLFIALIFLIRALGDFRYVGFFKKVRNSNFAKNDTQYFTPLCIVISFLATFIYLNS
jgi:hypothetical protein